MNRRTFCLTLGTGLLGSFTLHGETFGQADRTRTVFPPGRAKKIFPARWEDGPEQTLSEFDAVIVMSSPVSNRFIEQITKSIRRRSVFLPHAGLPETVLSAPVQPLPLSLDGEETDAFLLGDTILSFDASRCTWDIFVRHGFETRGVTDRLATARLLDRLRRGTS